MKKIWCINVVLLLVAAGCSTSKTTTSWKADNVINSKYNKVLVMGIMRDADRSGQMNMEIHAVGDLCDLGYKAVSGLQEFGPKAFDNIDEETAVAKLRNSGVDGIITIVLLDKQKEKKYIPANMYASPNGYYFNRFWGYKTAMSQRIYEPGYYATETQYFWESNLYDVNSRKLVYSVQTQSFDSAALVMMGHQFSQNIFKEMVKSNVLKKVDNMVTSR